MNTRVGKSILTVLFGAMLATPLVLRYTSTSNQPPESTDAETALARHGFYLEEVSQAVGITFTHQAPRLDPRLDHIMPQVASLGAGVSVVDFDRDGWQDLYVTNSGEGSRNALYRNRGDGTFEDVAQSLGVADVNQTKTGVSMGAVWGDYDNDGFEDLFLYRWGRPALFHNDGGGGFTPVTDQTDFPAWVNANTAIWFDYNRDGSLDLFLGGYFPETINLWKLTTTRIMPESFEYALNGGRNYLFRNRGDGTFEEVAEAMGLTSTRWTLAAAAADLHGTGYPDLVLANDYSVEEIYFNEEGKRFVEEGVSTQIGAAPKSGMNVSYGDVLNQGRFAIYVSNISQPGVLIQGNNLWVPEEPESRRYQNLASVLGIEMGGWSYGAQFGDLNNDGSLDLFLVNGYVSGRENTDYWYDFTKVSGGNASIISDAKNWPAMEGRNFSGRQQSHLWLNNGQGRFLDVANTVGAADRHDGRAVVLVDLWNRGVLDVVVANQRGPLLVYKNTVAPDRQWIGFALEGHAANRSAVGAQVELFWNGKRQVQEVSGGSGFAAQNQRRLHFGLGADPQIEQAVIRWPSGSMQTLEAPRPGMLHVVEEPN